MIFPLNGHRCVFLNLCQHCSLMPLCESVKVSIPVTWSHRLVRGDLGFDCQLTSIPGGRWGVWRALCMGKQRLVQTSLAIPQPWCCQPARRAWHLLIVEEALLIAQTGHILIILRALHCPRHQTPLNKD